MRISFLTWREMEICSTIQNVALYLEHNFKILNISLYIIQLSKPSWQRSSFYAEASFSQSHSFLSQLFLSIKDYQRSHLEVTVLDPPHAIQHLRNRQSMLEVVADLKLPDEYGILHRVLSAYIFHRMKPCYRSICSCLPKKLGPYSLLTNIVTVFVLFSIWGFP